MRKKFMKGSGGVLGTLKLNNAISIIKKWKDRNNVEEQLNLGGLNLKTLPPLPNNVKILNISFNQLRTLPRLPDSLKLLFCTHNKLTSLPSLPNSLNSLYCSVNKLTSLPTLPNTLDSLYCDHNKLTSLPTLPDSLYLLHCHNNKLTSLPSLPDRLKYLNCDYNELTTLPTLPDSLVLFTCENNKLREEYYRNEYENEFMEDYINRIRDLENSTTINSSEIKEVNENARNYISFDDIKNGNVLVNLKRSTNKYNSNYKEYITRNTYNTMLHKTLTHPLTRYKMKKKNVKYYTVKMKNKSEN